MKLLRSVRNQMVVTSTLLKFLLVLVLRGNPQAKQLSITILTNSTSAKPLLTHMTKLKQKKIK